MSLLPSYVLSSIQPLALKYAQSLAWQAAVMQKKGILSLFSSSECSESHQVLPSPTEPYQVLPSPAKSC